MARMSFLPELQRYLVAKGMIYTVRKFNMTMRQVQVAGVGVCLRKPLGEVFLKSELVKYAPQSGFATVDEWWTAIRHFVPITARMFLYEVSLQERVEVPSGVVLREVSK